MMRFLGLGLLAAAIGMTAGTSASSAQGFGLEHPASAYYHSGNRRSRYVRGPQVRGFAQRRVGGYSFGVADTINTYGDARTRYGGTSFYRDPMVDRQTIFGPFDHGFFFDSGIAPRGGNSPYPN